MVLGWDAPRETFLRGLRELGVAVRTVLVHAGPIPRGWEEAARTLGTITPLDVDEIERRLDEE